MGGIGGELLQESTIYTAGSKIQDYPAAGNSRLMFIHPDPNYDLAWRYFKVISCFKHLIFISNFLYGVFYFAELSKCKQVLRVFMLKSRKGTYS